MSPAGTRVPSGSQIRRITRQAGQHNSDARVWDLFDDIYIGLFSVAMAASMIFALSSGLAPDEGSIRATAQDGPGLAIGWVAVLPAIAAVAAFIGLVTRLGPLSLSSAESSWWLPLPVDRRSLLRPAAYRWPAMGLVVGAIGGAAVAFALPNGTPAAVGTTVFGAALTVTLVVVAGLAQPVPQASRALRRAADSVAAVVPLAGIALAINRSAPPEPGWVLLPIAVLLLGAALALGRTWDQRLGDVQAASLRHHGAVADEALVAVLSLDTRALGRALAIRTEAPQRSRSSKMRWLAKLPRTWRAPAALVTADVLLFARTPRQFVQVVLALGLPGLGLLVPDPGPASTIGLLLVGAYVASLATAEGARRAQIAPGLDAALPIGQRYVRLTRLVLPLTVMCLWFMVITAVLGWRYGGAPEWVLLGLLTGPAWAAAAVRAAYRPVTTFAGPLISTPMGSLPPGLTLSMSKGPDVALVGSVPIVVALILGNTYPILFSLQLPLSLIAVLIALYEPREKS